MNDREMIEYLRLYFEQFATLGFDPQINREALEDIDAHLELETPN